MKINDELYTRDGRVIGNCYITMIKDGCIYVVDSNCRTHKFTSDEAFNLFYYKKNESEVTSKMNIDLVNKYKIYSSVIDISKEAGMDLSLLRSVLYEKIKEL